MTARDRMTRIYDRTMRGGHERRFYDDSGFFNFGYWRPGTTSQGEASAALVDRLLELVPHKSGKILDVACGVGGSTRHLTRSYPPGDISAVNISEKQLAEARRRAPGCSFAGMDAAHLAFRDSSFDAVMCVEAAFHFDTREEFLREAFRVLKPGGRLVLSDILFRRLVRLFGDQVQVPRPNNVPTIAEYRAGLERIGFDAIEIEDATQACLGSFRRHLARWAGDERKAGRLTAAASVSAAIVCRLVAAYFGATCKNYLVVAARKPRDESFAP